MSSKVAEILVYYTPLDKIMLIILHFYLPMCYFLSVIV